MNDYVEHTTEAKRERIRKLVAWEVTRNSPGGLPADEPQTYEELAAELGVSRRSLYEYRKDPYYKEERRKAAIDLGRAAEAYELAMGVLTEIFLNENNPPTARVRAAVEVAKRAGALVDNSASLDVDALPENLEDVQREIDQLEKLLNEAE